MQFSDIKISLAARIALASAVFGLVVTCGVAATAFMALSNQLADRSSAELMQKRELLKHSLKKVPTVRDIFQSTSHFDDLLFGHRNLHLALTDPVSKELLANFSQPALESVSRFPTEPDAGSTPAIMRWVGTAGSQFSGVSATALIADGQAVRYYLTIDTTRDSQLVSDFAKAAALSLPLLLALVAGGAWWIARTALAPLQRFHKLAAGIGVNTLGKRLSLSQLPPELSELALEFNAMLARIDSSYSQLQEFAGDLAHEMRTPVATLLGRTQVALLRTRSTAELRDILESNVEEMERLARLISDMLLVASADSQKIAVNTLAFELAAVAKQMADFLSITADDKGVTLQVTGHAVVDADPLLIQRAITNLLSNAIRYAYSNSTVTLVIDSGVATTLSVTNIGDGIAPVHLARIFDRFYRVDTGRSRADGGTGLGLAIVCSIMSAHLGRVDVSSQCPGETTFTLVFAAK